MNNELLTIKNAAPLLRCCEMTLRRFVHAGKIGYQKIGNRYFVTTSDVEDFLASCRFTPVAGKGESE